MCSFLCSGLSLTSTPTALTLPTSFSILTYLTQLNLSSTKMSGSVPQTLSLFNQLVYVTRIVWQIMRLCMDDCKLGFALLSSVCRSLDLSYNALNGSVPGFLSLMTGLKYGSAPVSHGRFESPDMSVAAARCINVWA